ncbi:MAG: hypothetical protein K6F46_09360 [Desulfovibrio sp.]|nr:hypothetical protein [Desulfovibrio sp.]
MSQVAPKIDNGAFVQEAIENFLVLLDDMDFTDVFTLLGIGRLQFMLRRQMGIECRGLYIGLWRLALKRSFPNEADAMLAEFLERYTGNHPDKLSARAMERAGEYWGMLQARGDTDFRGVAAHLCSFLPREKQADQSLILRLLLHIRKTYELIFARLL